MNVLNHLFGFVFFLQLAWALWQTQPPSSCLALTLAAVCSSTSTILIAAYLFRCVFLSILRQTSCLRRPHGDQLVLPGLQLSDDLRRYALFSRKKTRPILGHVRAPDIQEPKVASRVGRDDEISASACAQLRAASDAATTDAKAAGRRSSGIIRAALMTASF
jgi:hypothetical protein